MKLTCIIALAVVAGVTAVQDCSTFANCGDCTSLNQNGNDHCYWCATEKTCVSAGKFEGFSLEVCRSVSFDTQECPADRVKSVLQVGTLAPRGLDGTIEAAGNSGGETEVTSAPITFKPISTSKPSVNLPASTQPAPVVSTVKATKPPVPTTESPPPPAAKTCNELGWDIEISGTCGESKVVNSGCPSEETYTYNAARATCESIGARLCKASELDADIGAGTGCGADNQLVWTSTSCASGHIAQAGQYAFSNVVDALGATCTSNNERAKIRCCATQPGYKPTFESPPPSTCNKLGWNTAPGRADVCAKSDVGGECYPAVSYSTARNLCASQGARLCSKEELSNGEAGDSGCKMDESRVWSSSDCFGGVTTLAGFFKFADEIPEQCSNKQSTAGLRCCADEPSAANQLIKCSALGWGFHGQGQSLGVCAESKINGECDNNALHHQEANARCEAVGTRLCTRSELQQDVAIGTGCKMDKEKVWSGTACDGGFWALGGSTLSNWAPECLKANTKLSGRCCSMA